MTMKGRAREKRVTVSRRGFLKTVGAIGGAAALEGVRPWIGPAIVHAEEPILIGQIVPQTGFLATMGMYGVTGAKIAAEEINEKGGVLGRKIQLIVEDEANPGVAAQKARKLIEKDKVIAITGTVSSASALVVGDEAQRAKTLFVNTGANSDEIRGARCHRYVFNTEGSNTQYVSAVATWLLQQSDLKRWYFLTSDYAFGHDLLKVSQRLLQKAGREQVGSELIPTGTADFSSYLLKVKAAKPDLVFQNLAGTDQTNFLKQFKEFGLEMQVAGGLVDTALVWPVGVEALTGHFPLLWWHELKYPGVAEFVAKFKKLATDPPENQGWADYTTIKVLAEVIKKVNSTESKALVKGMEGHQFESLKGRTLFFREWDHQLIMPMYTVRTKKKGEPKDKWDIFEVIAEVPAQGQSAEAIAIPRAESLCKMEPAD
jgi:branched-chain amino acid transport system substrate-binding protein